MGAVHRQRHRPSSWLGMGAGNQQKLHVGKQRKIKSDAGGLKSWAVEFILYPLERWGVLADSGAGQKLVFLGRLILAVEGSAD